jgi:hypothetical protein
MNYITAATSSGEGFLSRNLSLVPAAKFQYSLEPATDDSEQNVGSMIIIPLDDAESGLRIGDVDGSRWNTRGWTLQERFLSTRSIHFCKNKIYFECRGCLTSEENEPEQPNGISMWPLHKSPPSNFVGESGTSTEDDRIFWYENWKKLVSRYTHRRLTVESDKMTAIQSVAHEMAHHVIDRYIPSAGMWLGDIERQLLWHVESRLARRLELDIPSWSWASLDANITFMKRGTLTSQRLELLEQKVSITMDKTANGKDVLSVRGLQVAIHAGDKVDEDDWSRASFPYDFVDKNGNVFAHGILDLDNRDDILASLPKTHLMYLHIANDQRPSGLLLVEHDEQLRYMKRVGVATIFQLKGELIEPHAFDKDGGCSQESQVHLS